MQKMNTHNKEAGEEQLEGDSKGMKQSQRNSDYYLCIKNNLSEVANKFGLTAQEFAEHVKDEFQSNEVSQEPESPEAFANHYVTSQFSTAERVLKGARYMAAQQLACEPEIRKKVRKGEKYSNDKYRFINTNLEFRRHYTA